MIWSFIACLAVATLIALFDCKGANAVPTTKNPTININNSIAPQNETTSLQKNGTIVAQKNETVVKNDYLQTNQKPKTSKTRQVSADIPVPTTSTVTESMEAQQSFYPSALMMYPFPMMNTYYPRYFPYTYAGGYQGYPVYG